MKIVYKVGNLLDAPENVIAHGCNAQGVMGSGVAKAIKERFPQAYTVYRAAFESKQLIVGTNTYAGITSTKTIVNMVTQERYGRDHERRYVDYAAVRTCMRQLNGYQLIPYATGKEDFSVAMPLIGCGLGNGSWAVISRIIEEESTHFQPVVYTLDGIIPK
jgi:O-acetyl-ADP-ribose deacetylase (regulator of RNase III)